VKIQNAALVYHGVTVEDGVFIGPNAILTNDRFPRSITADGRLARAEDWTVSPIRLRTGASIGAGAVVVAGNDVGRFATVGAGAVVTRTCRPCARRRQPRAPHRLGLRVWHRLADATGCPFAADGSETQRAPCGSVPDEDGRCVALDAGGT
jgi:tetrahydrodipicolinate N-succinyltransferase